MKPQTTLPGSHLGHESPSLCPAHLRCPDRLLIGHLVACSVVRLSQDSGTYFEKFLFNNGP